MSETLVPLSQPTLSRSPQLRRNGLRLLAALSLGLLAASPARAEFTSPVLSYGTNGTAVFSVGEGFTLLEDEIGGIVAAAAADGDGQLYVLYRALPPTDSVSHLYLVRLTSSGNLDSTFARVDIGVSGNFDNNVSLALDASLSRLYLVTLPTTAVIDTITVSARRFDGSLDLAFNSGADLVINPGRVIEHRFSLGATVDAASGRLLLVSGFIVPSGGVSVPDPGLGNLEAVTLAVTASGQLDTTFSGDGVRIQAPVSTPAITSAIGFGTAVVGAGESGRILNFGSGRVSDARFVGTVFSDKADGTPETGFDGDGLAVVDIAPTTAPGEGESNLTQLLFGRLLPSGVAQIVGLTGVVRVASLTYVPGTTSVAGVQLLPDGSLDTRFSSDGTSITPYDVPSAPPTVLFSDGSIASVYRVSSTQIAVQALEGFSLFVDDGGTTTGGTTGGATTGGTTGGDTTGGTTGGDTTGGTTGGTTTGGTTGGGSTGGTTGGGTTGGSTTGSTTGGTTTGGTTGSSTTGGGSTTAGQSSGGGGSFSLFGLCGLLIAAGLRRRRAGTAGRRPV